MSVLLKQFIQFLQRVQFSQFVQLYDWYMFVAFVMKLDSVMFLPSFESVTCFDSMSNSERSMYSLNLMFFDARICLE